MKTVNTKTLLLVVFAALLIISLSSSRVPDNGSNIEFVASPAGVGIYNKETKTLYMYKMMMGGLSTKPSSIFKVSEDGSSLSDIK